MEWESKGEAIEALVYANHSEIPNPGMYLVWVVFLFFYVNVVAIATSHDFGWGKLFSVMKFQRHVLF